MIKECQLRAPNQMMRLSRLGSLHQSRLSFMRQLTRRLANENWQFTRPLFDINDQGEGVAVYQAAGPDHIYSLVAFAHDLPAEKRSDRVIADAWDATFTLFDGAPSAEDITRLKQNVPKQEAGRISANELSLSRANRSVRLWDYVVNTLAKGEQPAREEIDKIGYLMRTTAVYGSGKFGAADRLQIQSRIEMQAPFQAEMLSIYLTRAFVRDLAEHMAVTKGGAKATRLDDDLAHALGIGNSTGLGMAPFLINHPLLLNNWIMARERAIARVRALPKAKPEEVELFKHLLAKANAKLKSWQTEHPYGQQKLTALREDVDQINARLATSIFSQECPWNHLMNWAEDQLSEEGQEWLGSLILEPYGALVDDLTDEMSDQSDFPFIEGDASIAQMREAIAARYDWAKDINWQDQSALARIWYVSEEKLEPRLGERFEESLNQYEQPLGTALAAHKALEALKNWPDDTPIDEFLAEHPEHHRIIRRVQAFANAPYSEIHDNTLSASLMPIDMLRAKLSFFGATAFDPRSDRWVRITMYQGAPYPNELNRNNADYWVYEGAD